MSGCGPAPKALGTPAPDLTLFVMRSGDGLQVTNDTAAPWDQCTVELTGGFTAPIPLLAPHASARLAFDAFTRDRQPLPPGEGHSRAADTTITCAGTDYDRHQAHFTVR